MHRYVEKLRVPVQVALRGEDPVEGFLSLAPQAELHDGPETILERLNETVRMVPFHRADTGAVILFTRRQIDYVVASSDVHAELIRPATFMTTGEERLRVRLLGGAAFEGMLHMEQPEEFNRASDYLNGLEDFFPLDANDGTLLINKWRVLDVRVLEAAPRPETRAA